LKRKRLTKLRKILDLSDFFELIHCLEPVRAVLVLGTQQASLDEELLALFA
jgi:hypothetical protein